VKEASNKGAHVKQLYLYEIYRVGKFTVGTLIVANLVGGDTGRLVVTAKGPGDSFGG
jgi:hypothetical protein